MREDPKGEAMRWLVQSEEEIKDASFLANAGRYYLSLFLCQQIAEKALTGFLYLKEEDLLRTHSVATLLRIAAEIDPDFAQLGYTKRLDDYYILTRYPNGLPGETPAEYYDDPDEAERALSWSRKIVELVREKIESE
jgi:HEPN domain-containing protein